MKEKWKSVRGYKELYEVSNLGNVRSYYKPRSTILTEKPTTIKGGLSANGYRKITLYKQGKKKKSKWLHRVVLESFKGKCAIEGYECAHLNGDHTDNRLCNLTWVSKEENEKHKIKHGTSNRGERCGTAKLTEKDVKRIKRLYRKGVYNQRELSEKFGVLQNQISRIVNNKRWHYKEEK